MNFVVIGNRRFEMMFHRIVHADWSRDARKRWVAEATRQDDRWIAVAPRKVGDLEEFRRDLFVGGVPVLAGFDFPIGVPAVYGTLSGERDFDRLLAQVGQGRWSRFFEVCEKPQEISIDRPFYPRVSSNVVRQSHLLERLGVASIDGLRRASERATEARRAACALFWTLGGNQVGKAAISGWQDVIRPARLEGAGLWPFDGDLSALAAGRRVVLAETYPAEAYGHVGVAFDRGGSKQRQADRRAATRNLIERCEEHGIELSAELRGMIIDGFGPRKSGEDPFDAVIGLFGMIEVVEGRRQEAPAEIPDRHWEGWILGREHA